MRVISIQYLFKAVDSNRISQGENIARDDKEALDQTLGDGIELPSRYRKGARIHIYHFLYTFGQTFLCVCIPEACRASTARDRTHTTAVTKPTAVTMTFGQLLVTLS